MILEIRRTVDDLGKRLLIRKEHKRTNEDDGNVLPWMYGGYMGTYICKVQAVYLRWVHLK